MSEFLFVDDSRLEIIVELIEKLNTNPGLWASQGAALSQSLTSAESIWIALLLQARGDEKTIEDATSITERSLKILDLIGVPLTLPLSKLTKAQEDLITEGTDALKAINQLAGKWSEANRQNPQSQEGVDK